MKMACDAAAQQEAAAACVLVNAAHWQLQHAHVLFKVRMHVGYSGSMHTWQKPPPLQRVWGLIISAPCAASRRRRRAARGDVGAR